MRSTLSRHCLRLVVAAFGNLAVFAAETPPEEREPLADNSFLIEEAYNQEPGVIQHIQLFGRDRGGGWSSSFTEEWPIASQRHQASVTLPILEKAAGGAGIGDVALNYRWQALGVEGGPLAFAPRLSLLLPTGAERDGTGAGGTGVQTNLPMSVEHGSKFVTHWNAGATWTPSARDASGREAATLSWSVGASAVYLAASRMNFLLEAVYTRDESVVGDSRTERTSEAVLNPGVRFGFDRPSGLQIVPGIAFPFGVGSSRGERAILLYLSFEHPLPALSRPGGS